MREQLVIAVSRKLPRLVDCGCRYGDFDLLQRELAELVYFRGDNLPAGHQPELVATRHYVPRSYPFTFTNGIEAAHVEVDVATTEHDGKTLTFLACPGAVDLAQASVETNIVYFDVATGDRSAADVLGRIASRGVRMKQISERRIRAVTHLDVTDEHVAQALEAVATALEHNTG